MCKDEKIRYGNRCFSCINDCKEIVEIDNCIHYKKGFTRKEYKEHIQKLNLNLKKICTKYGLSLNIMYSMIEGRQHLSYKYRKVLDAQIYELQEYLPHIEKFEREYSEMVGRKYG